ncbi:MAG TPA: hypothetical protein VHC63_10880 [Acidimicrobiales bacterium]|nr:hypothetical protein [Acidimicrobiales bacterium]
MPRRTLRAAVATVALATVVFGAACSSSPNGTSAADIKQLPENELSGTYLGLKAQREDIGGSLANQQANAYIDAVGLYSLRDDKLLEATLQISKLSKQARPKSLKFQQLVANQIGGTKVQAFVMGGHHVYRSSQRKQSLTSWFQGDYFMILSVRDTYKSPRSLLRVLVDEVKPA